MVREASLQTARGSRLSHPQVTMAKIKPKAEPKAIKRPKAVGFSNIVPAARLRRAGSFVVDLTLVFSVMILGILPFTFPFAMAIVIGYIALRDTLRGPGRSLGRSMTGQRLMNVDGTSVTPGRAIGRSLVRFLLWITILPAFIDLFMFLFGDGRLIADHIFDTRVYEDPELIEEENLRRIRGQGGDHVQERHEHDALEHARFTDSDYDKRQLDSFEERLKSSHARAADEEADILDEEQALRDFEARLAEASAEVVEEEVVEEPVTSRR